jgi:purine-binding chemotaxis protein CheW
MSSAASEKKVNVSYSTEWQFVIMSVFGQQFGIQVSTVRDVLRAQKIAKIPLARSEIMGSINLRGRIVTVIDMQAKLGLGKRDPNSKCMHVVVDHGSEQYSLVVDAVGEVLTLSNDLFEPNPPNLSTHWQHVSKGVFRLKDQILVVLDIDNLLKF